jgi:hypothetical protein
MRYSRYIVLAIALLALAGLILPMVMRARGNADRIACENHLRELGLVGVRNASPPGKGLPTRPREELPPGTFVNPALPVDQRMSWYVYLLNVLNEGPSSTNPDAKRRQPTGLTETLATFDPATSWNSPSNTPLANLRLATAICPARVNDLVAGQPARSNYVANGGIGLDTPGLSPELAGRLAGAYRWDGPTSDESIADGLRQTAQFIETTADTVPWLQGGPGTNRGLDAPAIPYVGSNRAFGGCHTGGCYMSMADGSVRFIKDTIDPAVFRALLTRAGGPDELKLDTP